MKKNGARRERSSYIAPERLYTLAGFKEASGISQTRMREARMRGVEPVVLRVGKRCFIRGLDAITYIESLASLSAKR
jgi:hypothetical protein